MADDTRGDQVKAELLELKASDSMLHAETVVKWAKSHKKSALHTQFNWRVQEAAWEHWLWTARRLILMTIVNEKFEPQVVNLRWDRPRGGGYRAIDDVLSDAELTQRMLDDAIADLKRCEARYRRLDALAGVWKELQAVEKKTVKKPKRRMAHTRDVSGRAAAG